jgi:hypothetical protein
VHTDSYNFTYAFPTNTLHAFCQIPPINMLSNTPYPDTNHTVGVILAGGIPYNLAIK